MEKQGHLYKKRQHSINVAATVFLVPTIVILIVYIFYPIFQSFHFSFYNWNGISTNRIPSGWSNWISLLHDTSFWIAFRNNIIVMFLSILLQIPIGLLEATFLEFSKHRNIIFKIVWFIPLLMSSVAIGFLFRYALATGDGIVTSISTLLGGKSVDLLGNPRTALVTVIFVIAWQFTPFYMVYCRAAYTNIDSDIYEAALVDGSTRGKYFRYVALPLLAPSLKTAAIMSMVGSLNYFDLIYVMTDGGPGTSTELMATYMYKNSFEYFKMGYGSTIACGMFILISSIALVTLKLFDRRED